MGGWALLERGINARSALPPPSILFLSHACAKGKGEVGERGSGGILLDLPIRLLTMQGSFVEKGASI